MPGPRAARIGRARSPRSADRKGAVSVQRGSNEAGIRAARTADAAMGAKNPRSADAASRDCGARIQRVRVRAARTRRLFGASSFTLRKSCRCLCRLTAFARGRPAFCRHVRKEPGATQERRQARRSRGLRPRRGSSSRSLHSEPLRGSKIHGVCCWPCLISKNSGSSRRYPIGNC